jgi:hypothetical protein
VVFAHLLVSQLEKVDETQILRDGYLDLVAFALSLLDQPQTRYLHAHVLPQAKILDYFLT